MFPEDVAIVSCVLRGHVFLISLKNIANLATRRLPFPIQLSNSQGSAGPHRWGRVPFVRFPLPEKMRGAERRQALVRNAAPVVRLAVGPISGSPEMRAGSPALRLSALRCGVLTTASGRAFCGALGTAVSQLLAGDRCVPGRSPDAARVHAVRSAHPRAPPQSEARNCRAPAAGFEDLFSGPASGLLHHQDASR